MDLYNLYQSVLEMREDTIALMIKQTQLSEQILKTIQEVQEQMNSQEPVAEPAE